MKAVGKEKDGQSAGTFCPRLKEMVQMCPGHLPGFYWITKAEGSCLGTELSWRGEKKSFIIDKNYKIKRKRYLTYVMVMYIIEVSTRQ
ncbi:hypothetical protein [Angelakisella massiliensis]|uniref:hypothetical protein n=1 Tax=Angelakisella massiliensis TaxID=1871018 RepID=UPI0024B26B9A|nr:hypothetical protein [Angelakisella massiliensis]